MVLKDVKTQKCSVCGIEKPIEEFLLPTFGALRHYGTVCKRCRLKARGGDGDRGGSGGRKNKVTNDIKDAIANQNADQAEKTVASRVSFLDNKNQTASEGAKQTNAERDNMGKITGGQKDSTTRGWAQNTGFDSPTSTKGPRR